MQNLQKAVSVLVKPACPSNFPFSSEKTTVLLLGWAAARDEHLSKYSKIYEKEGFTTLRFTSPFTGHRRDLKYSRDVSGVVDNLRSVLERNDTRLALHLFSMNGVYTLCALLLQYPELNVLGRSDGIVFDSCPVVFDASSPKSFTHLADAISRTALKKASIATHIQFLMWRVYFAIGVRMFVAEQFARSLMGMDLSNFTPYHFIRDHPSVPQNLSFIYSDRDSICPPRTISDFHDHMAKTGRNVDVLRLTDSDHVEHFKKYPVEYLAVVHRFLASLEQLHRSSNADEGCGILPQKQRAQL
nr:Protein of unknown function DUF829 domain containing protein [Haemonchus contortus]